MRKIESKMVNAVAEFRNWSESNTAVRIEDDVASVYLHGNRIANVLGDGTVLPNIAVLAKYPTKTTKSRLRALGVDVYQKNWNIFIDGVKVC